MNLKVLHVASFTGNIGDNANHMGFRPWFESKVDRPIVWKSLEIREFYWKERAWDEDFVAYANEFDLLVIGGGNYFELWVEDSPTGTSIAIPPELFDRIRTPIFFNALGVDPGQGVPEFCRSRFRSFLDKLLGSEQYLVSVRNDGARKNLADCIGQEYSDRIHSLPDHGFFAAQVIERIPVEKKSSETRLVVNIANDMPETRFAGFETEQEFYKEFGGMILELAETHPDLELSLVPHIFRDLDAIARLLPHIEDRFRRTRMSIFSYGSGNDACRMALAEYDRADVVVGMRFHANVCSMGLGKQTLGLTCYPQIENLYLELQQPDRSIDVSKTGFSVQLKKSIEEALAGGNAFSRQPQGTIEDVSLHRKEFEKFLSEWLEQQRQNR